MDGNPLLERERELEVVEAALDRLVDGEGSTLLIEGPAGIGKTRLLGAAGELGPLPEPHGARDRAGQLEREMPFVVPRQLLEPQLERADATRAGRLLSGSAAVALLAFASTIRRGPGPRSTASPRSMACTGCSRTSVTSQPAVLVIDDVQWADAQSLRWLDYLARRAPDTTVLIVVGARTGEADEPAELEPLRNDATEVLRPSPLSATAVEALIAR